MKAKAVIQASQVQTSNCDPARSHASRPGNAVVGLQKMVGNQAMLRLLAAGAIQAKLRISQLDDADEREADRVADSVVSSPEQPTVQRKCNCEGGGASCPACEEEEVEQAKGIHRKAASSGDAGSVPNDFLHSLGPGKPLDSSTRGVMESRFGRDFSRVRVHTGPQAAESARAVNALAYTVDNSIAFAEGQYSPHSSEGRRLLAHELTHTVQQRMGGAPAGAKQEAEADTAARTVSRGEVPVIHAGSAVGMARQAHPDLSVPLTWDELFNKVISDQRAFLQTRPEEANNPAVDPAGVGRGVGPDRTVRGLEVLAAIQVVDKEGKRIAIGFGAHALLRGGHGEEQALAGLRNALPANVDLHGGKMMVVVDQYPCGADRHACGQQLRDFARERGLELEVRVPMRERVNQPGVRTSPRTASRGAHRTDLQADPRTRVRLVTIDQVPAPGTGGSGGSGGGGGAPGGGGSTPPAAEHEPTTPAKTAPPQPAPKKPAEEAPATKKPSPQPPEAKKPEVAPTSAKQLEAEHPAAKKPAPELHTASKPLTEQAVAKKPVSPKAPASPATTHEAPEPATARRKAPSAPAVEPAEHHGGGSHPGETALRAAKNAGGAAIKAYEAKLKQFIRENSHDKDLNWALDTLDKAADLHSFLENPAQFAAQSIKTQMIQGVFDHFSGILTGEQQKFTDRFPDVATIHKDPLDQGIALETYERAYNQAKANLSIPAKRKTLMYAYFLLGTNENTPDEEKKKRIAIANQVLLQQPDIAQYVNQFNQVHDLYAWALFSVTNEENVLLDELGNLPAGFADELRRRGTALNNAGNALTDLSDRIMKSGLIVFDPVFAVASELETLGSNFSRLGAQFDDFSDLAGHRRKEYETDRTKTTEKNQKVDADKSGPL
jgi:hypothetical protein